MLNANFIDSSAQFRPKVSLFTKHFINHVTRCHVVFKHIIFPFDSNVIDNLLSKL